MPLFQLSVSKLNSIGDQKQAWGAWESCKHPCSTPAPSTWQRSAKMNQSYLRLEGGCADSAIPVWNSSIGKREAGLLYERMCACLCVHLCGMERTASIRWGDFLCPQTGISVKSSVRHQSNGCRLSEPRQAHVSDCPKSAAGRPFPRIRMSASIQAELWTLYHWPVAPHPPGFPPPLYPFSISKISTWKLSQLTAGSAH